MLSRYSWLLQFTYANTAGETWSTCHQDLETAADRLLSDCGKSDIRYLGATGRLRFLTKKMEMDELLKGLGYFFPSATYEEKVQIVAGALIREIEKLDDVCISKKREMEHLIDIIEEFDALPSLTATKRITMQPTYWVQTLCTRGWSLLCGKCSKDSRTFSDVCSLFRTLFDTYQSPIDGLGDTLYRVQIEYFTRLEADETSCALPPEGCDLRDEGQKMHSISQQAYEQALDDHGYRRLGNLRECLKTRHTRGWIEHALGWAKTRPWAVLGSALVGYETLSANQQKATVYDLDERRVTDIFQEGCLEGQDTTPPYVYTPPIPDEDAVLVQKVALGKLAMIQMPLRTCYDAVAAVIAQSGGETEACLAYDVLSHLERESPKFLWEACGPLGAAKIAEEILGVRDGVGTPVISTPVTQKARRLAREAISFCSKNIPNQAGTECQRPSQKRLSGSCGSR